MIFSAALAVFVTVACMDITPPEAAPKKIIIKTVNEVAKMLSDILEGTEQATEEDKEYLFDLLVRAMAEDSHEDLYEFIYIGKKVLANEQTSVAWDTWLIIALRRLSTNMNATLPEAWFIECDKKVSATPEPTPILSALEKEDDELPHIDLAENDKQEANALPELDQSINSESVVSESDSDDSHQLLTEAGPMASPPAQTEEVTQIFTEEKKDITVDYKPVNKYIELVTGEERDLTSVD